MPEHRIGTQEEWRGGARRAARGGEGAHPPRRRARRRSGGSCPGCRSRRTTASRPRTGRRSLADLFDGRSQLLIYHFMFGPPYEAGCPVCSSIADTLDRAGPAPGGPGHDPAARLARPAREAPRLQGADGLGHRLGLEPAAATSTATSASSTPRRSCKPFLEGEIPPDRRRRTPRCAGRTPPATSPRARA